MRNFMLCLLFQFAVLIPPSYAEESPENIMDHQALGYTQEQIRRIAAYYGL